MSAIETPNTYRISVRALVEFCRTEGHLISQYRPGPSAFEGQFVHSTIQQKRGRNYQCEVSLSFTWLTQQLELTIVGRADGIFDGGIEEIKTSRIPPDEIPEAIRLQNKKQALVYAAILSLQSNVQIVKVRMTYVHPQTLQEFTNETSHHKTELVDYLASLCLHYESWLKQLETHWLKRQELLASLEFPYPTMRIAQRQMAETVYKACRTKRHATIEAPTGTGKSLATIFPALKAFTESGNRSLYFLTMKSTGKHAAAEALLQLDPEQRLAILFLAAKPQLCLNAKGICDGDYCPYAQDYYLKRNQLREQLFSNQHWNTDKLVELGQQYKICPYYLSQDWAIWSDVVIGDVNYIYDSTAVQPYLLKEINNHASILIDEGHNLIDRGRMMYSGEFTGQSLQQLLKEVPRPLKPALKTIQSALRTECRDKESRLSSSTPDKLLVVLKGFTSQSTQLLKDAPSYEPSNHWQEFLFQCIRFCRLNELSNKEDFAWRYYDGAPENRKIEILCLNPATLLSQKHNLVNNVIAFSATLQPWHYSNSLNGLQEAVVQALPSPFHRSQFNVYIANDVSTRYSQRHYLPKQLAATFDKVIHSNKNTMVFFSSYAQLKACTQILSNEEDILIHQSSWTKEIRDNVIDQFKTRRGLTLFTVLGGVFSEGIDLPNPALEQVIVIGPGLPQVNDINNAIKERFDSRFGSGFEFSYIFPGLQKVLQAVGRCVRTENDYGNILLIDNRFEEYKRRGWLPDFWTLCSGRLDDWQPNKE